MVICGSDMFEFSVSKDMKFNEIHASQEGRTGGGSRRYRGSGTFISTTN